VQAGALGAVVDLTTSTTAAVLTVAGDGGACTEAPWSHMHLMDLIFDISQSLVKEKRGNR